MYPIKKSFLSIIGFLFIHMLTTKFMEVLSKTNKNCPVYLTLILLLCGCQSSSGPRALKHPHPAYNQAIVNTLDQELFLNLVRLKYRDSPFFLKVGSV